MPLEKWSKGCLGIMKTFAMILAIGYNWSASKVFTLCKQVVFYG